MRTLILARYFFDFIGGLQQCIDSRHSEFAVGGYGTVPIILSDKLANVPKTFLGPVIAFLAAEYDVPTIDARGLRFAFLLLRRGTHMHQMSVFEFGFETLMIFRVGDMSVSHGFGVPVSILRGIDMRV